MRRYYLVGEEPMESLNDDGWPREIKLETRPAHTIERARIVAKCMAAENPGLRVAIYTALEVYGADLPDAALIEAPYENDQ